MCFCGCVCRLNQFNLPVSTEVSVSADMHLLSVIFSASQALFYSAQEEYCCWDNN